MCRSGGASSLSTMPTPTISVALCTYNGARFLPEQLETLRRQTVLPYELVAGDDQSSDETTAILARFAETAPFPVRVHVNGERLGPTKNFEATARRCSGDVVAFSDQDDLWHSEKVEAIAELFARDPAATACFSDAELVGSEGEPLGRTLWEVLDFTPVDRRRFAGGDVLDALLRRTIAFGAVMAFRSSVRPHAIPYGERWGHDNWTALVAAALGEVRLIERCLIRYRQHGGQLSSAMGSELWKRLGPPAQAANHAIRPDAAAFDALAARLVQVRGSSALPSRLDAIAQAAREKAVHLRVRERLDPTVAGRARLVARELVARRYHAYSNGLLSAARDLVWGAPPSQRST